MHSILNYIINFQAFQCEMKDFIFILYTCIHFLFLKFLQNIQWISTEFIKNFFPLFSKWWYNDLDM